MRLTVWYAVILAAMLAILLVSVHLLVRASLRSEIKREFARSLTAVESVVRDDVNMLPFFDTHSTIDFFLVRKLPAEKRKEDQPEPSAGAPVLATTSTLPHADAAASLPAPESLAPAAPVVYESQRWSDESLDPKGFPFRGLTQWPWTSPPPRSFRFETRKTDTKTGPYEIIVAQDAAPYERSLSRLTLYLLLAIPAALLMAGVGGYFLAARALSPVGIMADKAAYINAERLADRLPIDNPHDEFGRLATAFNSTLARLEDSFERMRRFTADASHELRTPLTAIRTVGEVGLAEPFNPAMCRDAVASMLEEADRLGRLVNDLMLLARGDVGAVPLTPERLSLRKLADEISELLRVLAEEKNQQLLVSGSDSVVVNGDSATLRQLLLNLIDNAVRHTPRGGTIQVVVSRSLNGDPRIEVRDEGPGIAEEHRNRIFDRFYRIDGEANGHENKPGSGLGLAIAKWAASVNRAHIELDTTHGRGSVFRVMFQPTVPNK